MNSQITPDKSSRNITKERLIRKLDELFSAFNYDKEMEKELIKIENEISGSIEKITKTKCPNQTQQNQSDIDSGLSRRRSSLRQSLMDENKVAKMVKLVPNMNGGVFFHPREMIKDDLLLTGGIDGVLKIWDIKPDFNKYDLINQFNTDIECITGIRYDNKQSHIYISTYSEYIFILNYDVRNNVLTLLDKFLTDLTLIYGFDLFYINSKSVLVCGGYTSSPETVYIYHNMPITPDKPNFQFKQSIAPSSSHICRSFAKSIRYCENLNLLIIGLINGVIDVYRYNFTSQNADFAYFIELSTSDWVYHMQIIFEINHSHSSHILASNANSLFLIEVYEDSFEIRKKKDFIASVHDFFYIANPELTFIKIKTGMVIIFDLHNNEVIDYLDESKKRGHYDHCLIASSTYRLLYSCRDHDILVYRF